MLSLDSMLEKTRLSLITLFLLTLFAGCAGVPEQPQPAPVVEAESQIDTPPIKLDSDELTDIASMRQDAKTAQDWIRYIEMSQLLWLQVDEAQQAQLERETWKSLQQASAAQIATLSQHRHEDIAEWGWLLEIEQPQKLNAQRSLQDLYQLAPNAIFNQHLVPELIAENQARFEHSSIAVLLPFSDRFRSVSEQIRAGILKAYWHSGHSHTLTFYDTQDSANIAELYQQAKRDGAERIIGPLTKESLERLAQLPTDNVIALNDLDQATDFIQFNYRNTDELNRLVAQLAEHSYQHLALMSVNSAQPKADELMQQWLAQQDFAITQHAYSDTSTNLRAEVNQMFNVVDSQSRAGFLQRTLGRSLSFFPRTRQDFQAIILLGNEDQLGVLQPQLEFYELNLPIYSTSELTPSRLFKAEANPDLKGIKIQTLPAAMVKSELSNSLQAFGWDSYQLAIYHDLINNPQVDLFLNGATGQLRIDPAQRINSELAWGEFNSQGRLQAKKSARFDPRPLPQPSAQLKADAELRQQLLEDIIRPHRPELMIEFDSHYEPAP